MSGRRPNILVLLADQLRPDILPAYGGQICQTPALDQLAAGSAVFDRAYTPTAVCTPARASLLTGLYPHNHGAISNQSQTAHGALADSPDLLSRRLQQLGYQNQYFGKWHLGGQDNLPRDLGLPGHQFPGHGDGGYGCPEHRHYRAERDLAFNVRSDPGQLGTQRYGVLEGPQDAEVSAFLAHDTITFLDQWHASGSDAPFFCWVNFWGPHEPYYPTADYLAQYNDVPIPPWPNFPDDSAARPLIHQMKTPSQSRTVGWDYWVPAIRHYFAFMTLIDHQIGRILRRLDELGLAEDTVVVFSADHGESLGAHGCQDKGYFMYEEIYRIPLFIRVPGQPPARHSELVCTIDLCPTLLDLAEDPDPVAGRDGESLKPLLDGITTDWRQVIAAEFHGLVTPYTQRMITDGRLKYVWNMGDLEELYDLRADPYELANLAAGQDTPAGLDRMRTALADWMRSSGDQAIAFYTVHLSHLQPPRTGALGSATV